MLRVGGAATVEGTEIRIRLDGVGHGWLAQGGGHFLFAELTVASEAGSRSLMAEQGDEIRVGEYALEVIGIDEEEDRCTLRVVRALDRDPGS